MTKVRICYEGEDKHFVDAIEFKGSVHILNNEVRIAVGKSLGKKLKKINDEKED